ncbi:Hypothetical predicted protein, partial [Mytilus galloprovincialis]
MPYTYFVESPLVLPSTTTASTTTTPTITTTNPTTTNLPPESPLVLPSTTTASTTNTPTITTTNPTTTNLPPESPLVLPSTTTASTTNTPTITTTNPTTTNLPPESPLVLPSTTTASTTTTPTITTTNPTTTNLPPEKQPKYADKLPVIIGTSIAVFVLILCIVILIKRTCVFKKRQETTYETNEMMNAETHTYGKTDTYHEYCNSTIKQTPATNNDIPLMEGDCLLETYNVVELTKRLNDAESFKSRIRAEFL